MYKISLVDDPAVMSNFQAFDKQHIPQIYSIQDEEKRLVRGVVMRADFPIYRYDAKMGEYYIIYKADQIRKMAEKYLVESRQNDVNLMHKEGSDVEGVQMALSSQSVTLSMMMCGQRSRKGHTRVSPWRASLTCSRRLMLMRCSQSWISLMGHSENFSNTQMIRL